MEDELVVGKLRRGIIDGLTDPRRWQTVFIAIHEDAQRNIGQKMAHHLNANIGVPPCVRGADDLTFCLLQGEDQKRWPIGSILYHLMYQLSSP